MSAKRQSSSQDGLTVMWFVRIAVVITAWKGLMEDSVVNIAEGHQLAKDIHVTQSTAWYMLQKIRLLYPQTDDEQFSGIVEYDEVYIGGKEKWKHKSMRTPHTQGRSIKTKTPVFGMMERGVFINNDGEEENMTYVHAFVVPNTNRATLQPIIEQFVDRGTTVITDELNAYRGLGTIGYRHEIVNHGIQEYANGDIFTNSIEGFWSHFRRMITGCYHDVSDEHLQSYIDEAVYRWNTRKMSESERFAQMFHSSIGCVRRWSEIRIGLEAA